MTGYADAPGEEIANAIAEGSSVLLQRIQGEQAARAVIRQRRNDIMSNFTPEEQAILSGPAPHYSQQDLDDDARYEAFKCCLTQDYPDSDDLVLWRRSYYSKIALDHYRAGRFPCIDPTTNVEVIDLEEWENGESHLTADEKEDYELLQAAYDLREAQRDAWNRYHYLKERHRLLRISNLSVELAEATNRTIGVSPEQQVEDIVQADAGEVALLGRDSIENGEVQVVVPPAAAPAVAPDAAPNNGRAPTNNRQNSRRRRQNPSSNNPLEEHAEDLRYLPVKFWEDPDADTAFTNFFSECRTLGYENTIHRATRQWTDANSDRMFQVGGHFYG